MEIPVTFYSYFKEITGVDQAVVSLEDGATIGDLQSAICSQYPKMEAMRQSTLIAVGVEYQDRNYVLQPGDEVSFFPPVQGGSQ